MKTNPRRRPATAADVIIAEKRGLKYGAASTAVIFLSVLRDKENTDMETLKRIWREANELADSIGDGYVNIADLRHALKNESGIEVTE